MAIKIQQIADNVQRIWDPPDPFTGSPRDLRFEPEPETAKRIFAKSNVYHRLFREMVLYAQRKTSGRSFLISGYRGAGKTMVVGNTIQDVAKYLAHKNYPVRPLYVRLHGPDLLPSAERKAAASKSVATAPTPDTESASPKPAQPAEPANSGSDSEIVLKQVAIALYRTAADEFWNSFRERIYETRNLHVGERNDLLELAAQLRVELDAAADLACFRTIWKRARRLAAGILFPLRRAPRHFFFPSREEARDWSGDQGFLELMAISSAAQAYRVVSGKTTETQVYSDEAKRQDKWSLALSTATKNLAAPLAGIAAGTLAGAAVYSTSAYGAIVAGVLSGLTVSLTLGYSGARSRDTTKKVEISFLPDRTLTSLDRMIPLLVERFRLAGLAPIFVVDELDKVPHPFERIGELVNQLKHFITERAFFCFITDRSYIEKLERDSLNLAYPRQHTYFSDRLLVYYMPLQLHDFLKPPDGILRIEASSSPELHQTELEDIEVLPYVLLQRSRMHAFDLRRELAKFTNEDDVLRCAPGVIRTWRRYLFDLLIQVAVEYLLEQPDLLTRNVDDPYFTQLALDALYYPSRSWERGEKYLDLTVLGFNRYIADRIDDNNDSAQVQKPAIRRLAAAKPPEAAKPPVSESDLDLLYRSAQRLVEFLVDPRSLLLAVEQLPLIDDGRSPAKPRFSAAVLDALPTDVLLLRDVPIEHYYQWQADISGRATEPQKLSQARSRWAASVRDITAFHLFLEAQGSGKLTIAEITTGLAILPSSPSWIAVDQALRRLDGKFGGIPGTADLENDLSDDQTTQDLDAVIRFAKMLLLNRETLTYALLISGVLNGYQKSDVSEKLKLISNSLQLSGLRSSQTRELLRNVWETWPESLQFRVSMANLWDVSLDRWRLKLSAMLESIAKVKPEDADDIVSLAWSRWKGDLSKLRPHIYDLIAFSLVPSRGPLAVLSYAFDSFSIYRWSRILLDQHSEEVNFLKGLAEEKLGIKNPATGIVLLVLADRDSKLEDWKPETGHGCVAVKRSQLITTDFTKFNYIILIELSGSPKDMGDQLGLDSTWLGVILPVSALWRYITFGRVKLNEFAKAPQPYLVSPSGIADAVEKAIATVPVAPRPKPRPLSLLQRWRAILVPAAVAILVALYWFGFRPLYREYQIGKLAKSLSAASNAMRLQAHSATPASVLLAIEAMRFRDSADAEQTLRANLNFFPTLVQREVETRPLQAVFSRDGGKLAVAEPGRTRVWSGANYRNLLSTIDKSCSTADFSPDRGMLALGCGTTVAVEDRSLPSLSPRSSVQKVLFANDNVLLSADVNGVLISDVNSGRPFAPSAHNFLERSQGFGSLDAAPYRNSFVYASATITGIWQFEQGKRTDRYPPQEGTINQVKYAPTGSTFDFATAGQNGDLLIWAWSVDGRIVKEHRLPCPGPLEHMAIGPKGQFVAANSGLAITLWNSIENRVYTLNGESAVTGLDFSPDGKLLAASGTTGRILLWDLATKEQVAELHTQGPANSVVFSPNGVYLAANSDIFQLWNMNGNADPASLSGEALIKETCSRLPVIPKIEWKTYLGGEAFRPVCK